MGVHRKEEVIVGLCGNVIYM